MAWSLKKALKKAAKKVVKAAKKVVKTLKKIVRVAQELAWRGASVFDFVGSLLGIQGTKHARLKVFVLFDENDPTETLVRDLPTVEQWVEKTRQIFESRLNVKLHPHKGKKGAIVHTLSAPTSVLTAPSCDFWAGFKDRTDWFDGHTKDTLFGYGGTMFVFIVTGFRSANRSGCAWPWIHNFCLVDAASASTIMAHELSHLCGIFPHSEAAGNLMLAAPSDSDTKLNQLQVSVARTARYVTYLNIQGPALEFED